MEVDGVWFSITLQPDEPADDQLFDAALLRLVERKCAADADYAVQAAKTILKSALETLPPGSEFTRTHLAEVLDHLRLLPC